MHRHFNCHCSVEKTGRCVLSVRLMEHSTRQADKRQPGDRMSQDDGARATEPSVVGLAGVPRGYAKLPAHV